MALLVGTTDALYRVDDGEFDDPEPILEPGHVRGIETTGGGAVVAATDDGLYRSRDGREWTAVGTPAESPTAVLDAGGTVYLGDRPARIYRSDDAGDTWTRVTAFEGFPDREAWRHGGGGPAQVRTLAWHPDAPDRLIAGIESAGAVLTTDGGDTWQRRDEGLHDDVHAILARSPRTLLAATGGGWYRTGDGGRTWVRCDTDLEHFHHRYCRDVVASEGILYTSLAGSGPFWDDGADALLVRSTDGGRTLAVEPYPGQPDAVVVSWTVDGGRVLGGTNEGVVIGETADGWERIGAVPVTERARGAYGITALCPVD